MARRKAAGKDEPIDERHPIGSVPDGMSPDEVIALINERANYKKKVKRDVIKRASDATNTFLLRRPFHIASLDVATGGGLPSGGITQFGAPDAVGKNAMAFQNIAAVQAVYGELARVCWCWTEVPLDKQHARINDVVIPSSDYDMDMENLERYERGLPDLTEDEITARQHAVGEFLVIDEGTTEQRLQAVIDLVAQNVCQVIVVDSIAAAVSKYRVDVSLEDEPKQSAEAGMLTDFQRMLWNMFASPQQGRMNTTSLIITNQVRADRSAKPGPFRREWKVGGPFAIRHGKLVDITLTKGRRIPEKGHPKKGKWVHWEVTKGKAGCHEGGKGEIAYYFSSGFDRFTDLILTAKRYGLLFQEKKTWTRIDAEGEVKEEKLRGGEGGQELVNRAYEDYEWFNELYMDCLKMGEASCLHKL